MRLTGLSTIAATALLVVSCTGDPEGGTPDPPGDGAASAKEAVDELVGFLNIPDFQAASNLAYPGQAALASLAEGATFGEVASALDDGDRGVAANFWSGFAQGTGSFLTGAVTTTEAGVETQQGVEFHRVKVVPPSGEGRVMLTRESSGHRIDLFASFGGGLAARMIAPVERLLSTQTEDSRIIMAALRDLVPSLIMAAGQEDLSPEASQNLTRLIELITRPG
jgi:hypothetical protein